MFLFKFNGFFVHKIKLFNLNKRKFYVKSHDNVKINLQTDDIWRAISRNFRSQIDFQTERFVVPFKN